jgi:hypothetical protein
MLTGSRKVLVAAALLILGSRTSAFAQNNQGAMEGTPTGDIGVKLSETNILHVGVAAEAGYDTNVFYNDANAQTSAVLRIIPSFNLTNNGRDGQPRSVVVYTLGANLTYREYLNKDENIRNQRAFVPKVVGSLAITGEKTRFTLGDSFARSEEAPYFAPPANASGQQPSGLIIRDINQANIGVGLSPGGGRFTFSLRYSNALDYFETQYTYASNMTHDGMMDISWKWLPKTALFLQGGAAYIHYLNPNDPGSMSSDPREDSTQVRGLLGLRGLITPKTTLNLQAGYQTAFYKESTAPGAPPTVNPSGTSTINALIDIGYLPTLLSRANLTLQHGFRNSPVIGDFYDSDSAALGYSHQLGQLVGGLHGAFEWRRYHNYAVPNPMMPAMLTPVDRNDVLFGGGVNFDYFIQRWFFAGVGYQVTLDRPNNDSGAVAYTKQQVFARLGLAY